MSSSTSNFKSKQIPDLKLPIWREAYSGLDWVALHYAPVYYGLGIPRGDKSAVIVVPGFLATDTYLGEMYHWLKRIGYSPYMSKIGRVNDCFDLMVNRLQTTIERAYRETGKKVHLVGHSMGGMLARAAATQNPDQVASVITLGSPFRGISSHPIVLEVGKLVSKRLQETGKRPDQTKCFTPRCNCRGFRALSSRFPTDKVMASAIYTKQDGVVDWKYCITDDPSANFEVYSTHIGLAFNPFVFQRVGKQLAESRRHEATKLSSLTKPQIA